MCAVDGEVSNLDRTMLESLDKRVYDLRGRIEQVAGDVKKLAGDVKTLEERLGGLADDVKAIRNQAWIFIGSVIVAPILALVVKSIFF